MKVKNINGTADAYCKCGSWLKHWEKFSEQPLPSYCSERSCIKTDLVGAHVQKYASTDSSWYIVPLCNFHNNTINPIEILDHIKLVPASKSGTCEKLNIPSLLNL